MRDAADRAAGAAARARASRAGRQRRFVAASADGTGAGGVPAAAPDAVSGALPELVEVALPEVRPVFPPARPDVAAALAAECVFSTTAAGAWLYRMNCLKFMDDLVATHPNGLFDAIFADPPYFLSNGGITCHAGRMVRVDKGSWDRSRGADVNHEFNTAWLSRCRKLLTPNGTLWVSGTHHVIHSVGFAMQQLGMKVLNDITWQKTNPPPNLSCRYFTHAAETIIWAARDERAKHHFDYAAMKALNHGKQMKSVWTIAAPGKAEKTYGKHPTQKPVVLLDRILLASTREDDLVFDPFAGSATTGVSAIALRRRFVGCELDPDFIDLAVKRLAAEVASRNGRLEFEETP